MSDRSSDVVARLPLERLIEQWRAQAMAAGQYSVECPSSEESEHVATADTFKQCADALAACLGASQEAQEPEEDQALMDQHDRPEEVVAVALMAAFIHAEDQYAGCKAPAAWMPQYDRACPFWCFWNTPLALCTECAGFKAQATSHFLSLVPCLGAAVLPPSPQEKP